VCRALVEQHAEHTQSRWAAGLLNDWDREQARFWQIVPKEMIDRLAQPVSREGLAEARA
jgi:glutamate synthase (NADPH/NADH) large chain